MPKPAASERSQSRPTAMELFTDRDREQELLRAALAPGPTPPEHPERFLTVFYGVGGVGKSTLCWRARETAGTEFRDNPPVLLHLDLDGSGWHPNTGFVALAAELARAMNRKDVGIQPRLTLALLVIYAQCDGRTATEMPAGLCWDTAVEVVDKGVELSGIPGVGLMLKGARWLRDRAEQDATRRRLRELNLWPVEASGRINMVDLDGKIANALYDDIRSWLADNPRRHVRLLVDGFERIQSQERKPDAQQRFQEFLGAFAASSDREVAGRFRAVVFGRERLRWDELYEDSGWAKCWNQHLLEGLSETDARRFLTTLSRWWRDHGNGELDAATEKYVPAILDAADERRGNDRLIYPYYLDLALEHLQNSISRGEAPDFGATPAELQDRFLRYLAPDELDALMVLALAGEFDERLFRSLAEKRVINLPAHSFHRRLRQEHTYFEATTEDGRTWRFHRHFQDALMARWRGSDALRHEAQGVIGSLLDCFKAAIDGKPERDWTSAQIEAWRHGVDILVTHGPGTGLIPVDTWKELLNEAPWSAAHPACLRLRLAFAQRTLAGCEHQLGPEHADTLRCVTHLASLLNDCGDYGAAEKCCRRGLEAHERTLDPDHRDTLRDVHNLAVVLSHRGDYAAAERLFRRALEACERALGSEDLDTLTNLMTLATLLGNQGYYPVAERLHRRALEAMERVVGPAHPHTLHSVSNLAVLLSCRGDHAAAEKLYRRALEARQRMLGPEHPDTLTSAHNLACVLAECGSQAESEKLHRWLIETQNRTLGPEHPDTLASVNSLADCLVGLGDHTEAEELYRHALDARERLLGPEHPDTMCSFDRLIRLLNHSRDYGGALHLAERLNESCQKARANDPVRWPHFSSMDIQSLAAWAGVPLGGATDDLYAEEDRYARKLEFIEAFVGLEDPVALVCANQLVMALCKRGDYDEAETMYRRVLDARDRALPPDHPDTLNGVENLSLWLDSWGRPANAAALLKHYAGLSPDACRRLRYPWACSACLAGDLETARELINAEIRENPMALDRAVKHPDFEAIREFLLQLKQDAAATQTKDIPENVVQSEGKSSRQ